LTKPHRSKSKFSQLTTHNSQLTTHNSQLTTNFIRSGAWFAPGSEINKIPTPFFRLTAGLAAFLRFYTTGSGVLYTVPGTPYTTGSGVLYTVPGTPPSSLLLPELLPGERRFCVWISFTQILILFVCQTLWQFFPGF